MTNTPIDAVQRLKIRLEEARKLVDTPKLGASVLGPLAADIVRRAHADFKTDSEIGLSGKLVTTITSVETTS